MECIYNTWLGIRSGITNPQTIYHTNHTLFLKYGSALRHEVGGLKYGGGSLNKGGDGCKGGVGGFKRGAGGCMGGVCGCTSGAGGCIGRVGGFKHDRR